MGVIILPNTGQRSLREIIKHNMVSKTMLVIFFMATVGSVLAQNQLAICGTSVLAQYERQAGVNYPSVLEMNDMTPTHPLPTRTFEDCACICERTQGCEVFHYNSCNGKTECWLKNNRARKPGVRKNGGPTCEVSGVMLAQG